MTDGGADNPSVQPLSSGKSSVNCTFSQCFIGSNYIPEFNYIHFIGTSRELQLKSRGLLDTGSTYCLISKSCLSEEILEFMQPTTMSLNGIACNPIKALGKLTLNISIVGLEVPGIAFFVLPTNCPTLIGQTHSSSNGEIS